MSSKRLQIVIAVAVVFIGGCLCFRHINAEARRAEEYHAQMERKAAAQHKADKRKAYLKNIREAKRAQDAKEAALRASMPKRIAEEQCAKAHGPKPKLQHHVFGTRWADDSVLPVADWLAENLKKPWLLTFDDEKWSVTPTHDGWLVRCKYQSRVGEKYEPNASRVVERSFLVSRGQVTKTWLEKGRSDDLKPELTWQVKPTFQSRTLQRINEQREALRANGK